MSEEVDGQLDSEKAAKVQLYLLHDSSLEPQRLAEKVPEVPFTPVPWAERESLEEGTRVLLYLGDEQVRDLAPLALERSWEIGLLPHPEAPQATTSLGVKGSLPTFLPYYRDASPIEADALTCNGELVFTSVVIGRVLSLRPYDINRPQTLWSLVTGAFKNLRGLRMHNLRLTTGKDRVIQIAALGMVVVGHTQSSLLGRRFEEDLNISDGRLSALALAPRSSASYLKFILRLLWPQKISLARLPASLGLIQSNRIHVEEQEGVDYLLDGKPVHAKEVEITVLEKQLQLLPGPELKRREEQPASQGKDRVRLNHIPVDEGAKPLTGQKLPLFDHASEEEYRELFTSLRESASVSSSYKVLMILSVMIALSGMYANSAPVIIGAMILAPLMSPIVSLAMGLARSEAILIRGSLSTLGVGVALGLACAVMLAWAMPLDIPTQEMKARMSPTLLDLLIAVLSGVAGAYASAKEEIAKSLAGVAIAVALVPPLSVVGIGLGWGDWEMARGAGLLLITNLVGISLAASATFLVLGFAPFHRAKKGLGISLAIVAVISAPLYVAFTQLVDKGNIREQVPVGEVLLAGHIVHVSHVRVTLGEQPLVNVVLSSPEPIAASQIDALKQAISERVGTPVMLEAQLNIRR